MLARWFDAGAETVNQPVRNDGHAANDAQAMAHRVSSYIWLRYAATNGAAPAAVSYRLSELCRIECTHGFACQFAIMSAAYLTDWRARNAPRLFCFAHGNVIALSFK